MADRQQEIREAIAGFEFRVDDLETMRAFDELQKITDEYNRDGKDMELSQLVTLLDRIVTAIDGMLGEGAARSILGPRTNIGELTIAYKEIFRRYKAIAGSAEGQIHELMATVPEE